MRADAARNRDKIVEAARVAFRTRGYDAPLDDIAKAAGVGAGTLYRHFPTRESLVDAVMQAWVAQVNDTVGKVRAEGGTPRELLLRWFENYVQLISVHKGGPAKITSAMEDETSPIQTKCQALRAANAQIIEELGDGLRPGVDSLQFARLVGGIASVVDQGNLPAASVGPMLEVVVDGLLA
ncbi:MAG: TetR/AcrR family transcriptional regulator [Jatrophihabitans sp.]|uniref:TetR/AcrR family transcriptional regulator n=1 Tax=Jatrophihabitans sp. TaxID=1932789 RepID=UPI0039164A23